MSTFRQLFFILILLGTLIAGNACDDDPAVVPQPQPQPQPQPEPPEEATLDSIEPAGNNELPRDQTLQFSALPAGVSVTWSLSSDSGFAGDLGTISADGLYTPPARNMIPDSLVTVTATDSSGNSATAQVTLLTGATISFEAAERINDVGIFNLITQNDLNVTHFADDRSVVFEGSLIEGMIFSGGTAVAETSVNYAESVNFGNFTMPFDIYEGATLSLASGLEARSDGSLIALAIPDAPTKRVHYSFSDSSRTGFKAPQPLDTDLITLDQTEAHSAIDLNDTLHVTYGLGNGSFRYTKLFQDATLSMPLVFTPSVSGHTYSEPKVASNGQIVALVAKETINAATTNTVVFISFDAGENFSPALSFNDVMLASNPMVAIDSQNRVYLGFVDQATGRIYWRVSTNLGASFSAAHEVTVDSANVTELYAKMSVSQQGSLQFVWSADPKANGNEIIMHAYKSGLDADFAYRQLDLVDGVSSEIPVSLRFDSFGRVYMSALSLDSAVGATNAYSLMGN